MLAGTALKFYSRAKGGSLSTTYSEGKTWSQHADVELTFQFKLAKSGL